jgi:homoserine O-acetyltransferase
MSPNNPLPVTGAWRPGDEPGHRRFFTFAADRRFALDCGVALSDVVVAYETWGRLDADAANAILLCHAWTGDSHAAGPAGRGHPTPGW